MFCFTFFDRLLSDFKEFHSASFIKPLHFQCRVV